MRVLYFVWVFICGSIPGIGPFLAWNLGFKLGERHGIVNSLAAMQAIAAAEEAKQ